MQYHDWTHVLLRKASSTLIDWMCVQERQRHHQVLRLPSTRPRAFSPLARAPIFLSLAMTAPLLASPGPRQSINEPTIAYKLLMRGIPNGDEDLREVESHPND
jgi:hypothetical protein